MAGQCIQCHNRHLLMQGRNLLRQLASLQTPLVSEALPVVLVMVANIIRHETMLSNTGSAAACRRFRDYLWIGHMQHMRCYETALNFWRRLRSNPQ